MWRALSNAIMQGHSQRVTCLDAGADLLVSGSDDGSLRVWSLQTGAQLSVLSLQSQGSPTEPSEVKILGEKDRVVCWTRAGSLQLYQCQPLLELESLLLNNDLEKEAEEVVGVGVSAVGENHLAIRTGPKRVLLYSTSTGLRQGAITSLSPATISALAVEADSLYVVCGDRVEVWDLTSWACLAIIQAGHTTPHIRDPHLVT